MSWIGCRFPVMAAVLAGLLLPARADQRIALERGRLTEGQWQAVKSHLLTGVPESDFAAFLMSYMDATTPAEAWSRFRDWRVYSGYYDLDGDGQDELFAYIHLVCGTVGCETVIFRKRNGRWEQMADVPVTDTDYLCVSDERRQGYADVYSYVYGLWWNGREFGSVCINDCEGSPDAALSRQELALRQEFRARGWCGQPRSGGDGTP